MLLNLSVNARRKALNIPIKKVQEVCGWNSRNTYFDKISDIEKVWTLEELVNLLNLFNCTFEELFIEGIYEERAQVNFWIARNLLKRILRYAEYANVKKAELFKSIGSGGTRQNFYNRINKQALRLSQIFSLLDLLNCTFKDLFLEEIKFTILPDLNTVWDENII